MSSACSGRAWRRPAARLAGLVGLRARAPRRAPAPSRCKRRALQEPIPTSLLKLNNDYCARAVKMFTGILKYSGDTNESLPQAQRLEIAQKLLHQALKRVELKDELYMQLIKQTRCNLGQDSLVKTWELLYLIASTTPPSKDYIGGPPLPQTGSAMHCSAAPLAHRGPQRVGLAQLQPGQAVRLAPPPPPDPDPAPRASRPGVGVHPQQRAQRGLHGGPLQGRGGAHLGQPQAQRQGRPAPDAAGAGGD
jgi:hypothetical protein